MSYSRRSNTHILVYIVMALVAVALIGAVAYGCAAAQRVETKVFTITGKESVSTRGSDGTTDHEYRVYTDKGTFVVKDSLLHTRFDSADLYGRLKENTTYRCEVFGFRIPLFSTFQNILSCTERP